MAEGACTGHPNNQNMRLKRLLSLVILYIICCGAFAQYPYRITHYDEEDGLMETEIFQGHQDAEGLIWFASRNGLLRYDSHRFTTFKAYPGDDCPLQSNHIGRFVETGDKFICLSQDKAYFFDKTTGKFSPADSMPEKKAEDFELDSLREHIKNLPEFRGTDKVKVRLVDSQGGIWVRTNQGLYRIEHLAKRAAPVKTGSDAEEEVRALMIDRDGNKWVADKNRFLKIYDRKGTLAYLTPNGNVSASRQPFGFRAYCIYEDKRGRIWIGCKPGGLFRLERKGGKYTISHFPDSKEKYALNCNAIYDIAEDKYGRLWAATYGGGLNMLDERTDGTIQFVNKGNALAQYPADAMFIHGIDITRNGILVAATTRGLVTARVTEKASEIKFCTNRRRPNDVSSLPTDYLTDIIETRDGRLVITTNGGGICYASAKNCNLLKDSIRFLTYNSQGDIATDVFMSLTEDHHGNIWAVGKTSLTMIHKDGDKIENFKKSHFGGQFMFSEAMPVCDKNGMMTLGTTQGHLTLNLQEMDKNRFAPYIKIYSPDTIRLSPEEKSFMVTFSAIDFNRHEPIRYAYILEGLDKQWQYTLDNHIYYGNIPGGTYRLRVKSTNSDGVWTDNEKCVTIIRRPAFNETRTAWMLYGILLIVSVLAIYYTMRYIRRLRKEMTTYQLKASEQIEYMTSRIRELAAHNSEIVGDGETGAEYEEEDFAAKAKTYMREHISDNAISVESFARYMNMSKSLFYLKCKKYLGYTPSNYIQNTRLSHATYLLKNSGTSNISDIAYKCGFSDPKYFSRLFKKTKGMTPTEYAAQNQTTGHEGQQQE